MLCSLQLCVHLCAHPTPSYYHHPEFILPFFSLDPPSDIKVALDNLEPFKTLISLGMATVEYFRITTLQINL